jgi:hypothetical protein
MESEKLFVENSEEDEPQGEKKESNEINMPTNDTNGTESKAPVSEGEKRSKRAPKGSVPPSLNLKEAAAVVRKIYEIAGGKVLRGDSQEIFGNSPSSSVFQRKLITLKNYGLVTEDNDTISLTENAFPVAAPKNEQEYAEGLKRAFLKVDVFAKIYEQFKGRPLPQDMFLINTFRDYVPRELADNWVDKFKESAKEVGLLKETDGKFQVLETPMVASEPENKSEKEPPDEKIPPPAAKPPDDKKEHQPDLNRMPIPLGRERLAYLELPADWNVKELKKLVSILKLALGDDTDIETEK